MISTKNPYRYTGLDCIVPATGMDCFCDDIGSDGTSGTGIDPSIECRI